MDRKSVSFLALGLLLGVLVTSAAFTLTQRSGGVVAAAASPQGGGGAAPQAKKVLKIAHVLDQGHPVHKAMEHMKQVLAEKSSGSMELQIFPNSQLGSETETIEQVQRGALAMAKTSAAPLEGFMPNMAVFSLPYLFRDDDHYWKTLLGEVGQELAASGDKVGLKGVAYYDAGARSFYMLKAPVMSPTDLGDKKIRVMRSKTSMKLIEQLGGAPTPIPWGELYSALQQGMVDGAENNTPSFFSSRHYEVAKHYSLDEHTRIPDIIMFSKKIWDKLSAEQQGWVQEAADASVTFQRKIWKESTEESLGKLKEAGVTVYEVDKKPFEDKVAPLYAELDGTPLGKLVERIRAVK